MLRQGYLALTCLFLACCSPPDDRNPELPLSAQDASRIELHVPNKPLPPESTNVYYQDWEGMDSFQVVRFDLPLAKAKAIMTDLTGMAPAAVSPDGVRAMRKTGLPFPSWWTIPEGAQGVTGARKDSCWPQSYVIVPTEGIARVYFTSSTC
ncbi:MAG TPA: hypothetical protein VFV30_09180 [Novosphingobium sp.]|nr:hypothetical protein [Novosphingobium sp.]